VIALDTNVLVRFLVADDQEQNRRAREFIEAAVQKEDVLYISDIVLVETVWVLSRSYQFTRQEISKILHKLLAARYLVFSAPDQLGRALDAFEHGRGGFADYLIREHAHHVGCDRIATFDQALLKENGFIGL
jgi:predicted nucleic-acid-binding protein